MGHPCDNAYCLCLTASNFRSSLQDPSQTISPCLQSCISLKIYENIKSMWIFGVDSWENKIKKTLKRDECLMLKKE